MSYEKELDFAKHVAREAGEIIRTFFAQNDTGAIWKPDNTPLTEADKQVNALVIERVKDHFPDHGVLGEEASYEENRAMIWIVDPIDGTQPFDLKVPTSMFCLGLALNGEVVLGVVYDPYMDRLYSAVKGGGAYINDVLVSKSKESATTLGQHYIVLSSKHGDGYASTGTVADKITEQGGKWFNFRSVVYGLMCVVSGRAVAAVAGPSYPWDFAAASIILLEAGLVVSDLDGNAIDIFAPRKGMIVSANEQIHEKILDLVKKP